MLTSLNFVTTVGEIHDHKSTLITNHIQQIPQFPHSLPLKLMNMLKSRSAQFFGEK
jgi:hypothetical protein